MSNGAEARPLVGPSVEVNSAFFISYACSITQPGHKVLDFGCGRGGLVAELRARGVDCYGTDVFYEGGDWRHLDDDPLLREAIVRPAAPGDPLPFEADTFDLILSNQVFERVTEIAPVVQALARVLKATGRMRHPFPSFEVWREGHIGIRFAHRFGPTQRRHAYVRALRALGCGYHCDTRTSRVWTDESLNWLDQYCHYRPYREIVAEFSRCFSIRHDEISYCRFRAAPRPALAQVLGVRALQSVAEALFRRLAFMALEMFPLSEPRLCSRR